MFGNRFKAIRKRVGCTVAVFSESINISKGALSKIENNLSVPSGNTLVSLSKRYRVNPSWLLTGEGEMFAAHPPSPSRDSCQLLEVSGDISAGLPACGKTDPPLSFKIGNSYINNVDDYYCFRVNGNNMLPEVIDNDLVLFLKDTVWKARPSNICAVRIRGITEIKRISYSDKPGLFFLESRYNDRDPIEVDPKATEVVLLGFLKYTFRTNR